jgi:NADH/NAD ratio-sensing transcriptional regulator Rex
VADLLVAAGAAGDVNFAPVTLSLAGHIGPVGADQATNPQRIAFSVANRASSR